MHIRVICHASTEIIEKKKRTCSHYPLNAIVFFSIQTNQICASMGQYFQWY